MKLICSKKLIVKNYGLILFWALLIQSSSFLLNDMYITDFTIKMIIIKSLIHDENVRLSLSYPFKVS